MSTQIIQFIVSFNMDCKIWLIHDPTVSVDYVDSVHLYV